MLCFKNGQLIDSIPLLDRAFHYGDGCFTTARFHQNVWELESSHRQRLQDSATRLLLQYDVDLLGMSLQALRQQFASLSGTLKIILSRGEGHRGYALPDHAADVYVIFYPQSTQDHKIETIDSGLLKQKIGLSMPELVGLKTLNRIEQVLLKEEAVQQQWIEALVQDLQGNIVEGVSSNCFLRINNTWITPELRYNGVLGVMRAEILQRMQTNGISCTQRVVSVDEIASIQSLFFCNALSPMKAVHHLEQRLLDLQPCVELFETLKLNQFNSYVKDSA